MDGAEQMIQFSSNLQAGYYTLVISHPGQVKLCVAVRVRVDGTLSVPVKNAFRRDWFLEQREYVVPVKSYDPKSMSE